MKSLGSFNQSSQCSQHVITGSRPPHPQWEEQLDRHFKGLRDVQERKIHANNKRLTRVEDRMIKGEVHNMLLSEKVEGVQAWM